jgi:hypothetical protein
MIVRLSTVHEDAQAVSLVLKEGSGLVGREAGAGAHDPLPPRPLRRGVVSMAGRKLERGQQEGKKPGKCEKDVKIEGTNSISPLESTEVPKNKLKTNWFLSAKKAKQTRKSGQKNVFCGAFDANRSVVTGSLGVGHTHSSCTRPDAHPVQVPHTRKTVYAPPPARE